MANSSKKKNELDELKRQEIGARTAKTASLTIFGRFAAIIISGIAFIIVARVLGPSVYGIYTLAVSFAGFFGAVTDFGVNTAVAKFIGEHSAKGVKGDLDRVLSNGYTLVILSGLLFTLIALLLSNFIAIHILGNANQTYVIQIISFAILLAVVFNFSYNSLIGFGKGSYIALVIIIQSLFQSVLSISLAILGFGALAPILGLLLGYLVSIITVIIILVTKFKITFVMPSMDYIKKLLGFSSPIFIYNCFRGLIYNLSPIVLGLFTTLVIVGNFGVALRVSGIITNLTDSFGIVLLPMFAYTVSKRGMSKNIGKFYNYAAYVTYVLVTPALLYLSVLAKQFSYTVFSAKYVFAPAYISIISIGTLLWIVATYTYVLLISTNKVKEILKYSIIIVCIELVLLFTLVPLFGGIGLTTMYFIISPAMIIFFMSIPIRKLLGIHLDVLKLARVFGAGVISVAFILPLLILLPGQYITILIIGFVEQLILYPIIIALTGAVNKEELKIIRVITGSIPVANNIIKIFADYSEHFVRS